MKKSKNKVLLKDWIISLFPINYQDLDYCEPYIGECNILLNKAPSSKIEAINDSNTGTIQIFRAMKEEPIEFINKLKKTRYSERVFKRELARQEDLSGMPFQDYLDHAISEYIIRKMSRGQAKKVFSPSDQVWQTSLKLIPDISNRIKNVKIFNKEAVELISSFDNKKTLFFINPPVVEDEEIMRSNLTKLAEELNKCHGKVILYGCPNKICSEIYESWRCEKRKIAKGGQKRIESAWMNW